MQGRGFWTVVGEGGRDRAEERARREAAVVRASSVQRQVHSGGQLHSASRTSLLASHEARTYVRVDRKACGVHDSAICLTFASPSASSRLAPTDGRGVSGRTGG